MLHATQLASHTHAALFTLRHHMARLSSRSSVDVGFVEKKSSLARFESDKGETESVQKSAARQNPARFDRVEKEGMCFDDFLGFYQRRRGERKKKFADI